MNKPSLNEPIEGLSTQEKLHLSWITGLFLFLFMVYFQPFGVNNYRPDEAINTELLMGVTIFSLATTAVIALNELLIYRWFVRRLTRLTALLWIAWSLLLLSTSLFLTYNLLGNWHDWHWSSFLGFIVNITSLAALPIAGVMVYLYIKGLKDSLNRSYEFRSATNEGIVTVKILAENNKDFFSTRLKDLLYIQSEDNYITIFYLDEQTINKHLLRNTLKAIESTQLHPALVRCHRSYLINLYHLKKVSGNRNKLELRLGSVEDLIPVGRQYAESIILLTSAPV